MTTASTDLPTAPTCLDPRVLAALGPGPDLPSDQLRVLAIIAEPKNAPESGHRDEPRSIEDQLEELEFYGDDTSFYGPEQLAELLASHYNAKSGTDGAGDFSFGLDVGADFCEVGSYTVGVYLGWRQGGGYLVSFNDPKYLSARRGLGSSLDEPPSKLRQALYVAQVIDGDYQQMRHRAAQAGLVEPMGQDQ